MKSAKTLEVLILTLPFNKRTEINCGLQGMIFISISIHIHPFTLIHTNISGQNIKKSTLIFFSADICFFIFKYQESLDSTNVFYRHKLYYAGLSMRAGCRAITTDACVPISKLPEMLIRTREDIDEAGLIGMIQSIFCWFSDFDFWYQIHGRFLHLQNDTPNLYREL